MFFASQLSVYLQGLFRAVDIHVVDPLDNVAVLNSYFLIQGAWLDRIYPEPVALSILEAWDNSRLRGQHI